MLKSEITSAAARVGVGAATVGGAEALSVTTPAAAVSPRRAFTVVVPAPTSVIPPVSVTVATAELADEKVK